MIWEGKRLNEVTELDLRKILESGTEEHKHLDYKAELYPSNDAGQKDFLIDVCAFANAEGGILLIGVPEARDPQNGKPTGVPDPSKFEGIEVPNPESVLLGYDSRVVSCIEDRLSLETHAVKLSNGRYVFAIRVPNSLNKPHCVRRDEKRYFPSRRDRHIYYMAGGRPLATRPTIDPHESEGGLPFRSLFMKRWGCFSLASAQPIP